MSRPPESDDALPSPAPSTGAITVPLRKPVQAYGEERRQLVFREPTAADIMACGDPVQFDMAHDPPRPVFEPRAMSAMMAALATVPASAIAGMHPKDWKNCAWMLAGFFTPDLGGTS